MTFARMQTLRSPQGADRTGLGRSDTDLSARCSPPSSARRRWERAATASTGRCGWIICAGNRRVLKLPVENETLVSRITPRKGLLQTRPRATRLQPLGRSGADLRPQGGCWRPGARGSGAPAIPAFRRASAAEPLRAFLRPDRLRAACAGGAWWWWASGPRRWTMPRRPLERGAAEVRLVIRRAHDAADQQADGTLAAPVSPPPSRCSRTPGNGVSCTTQGEQATPRRRAIPRSASAAMPTRSSISTARCAAFRCTATIW